MSEDMNQGRTFEILTADPVRTRRKPKVWSDEAKALILEEASSANAYCLSARCGHGFAVSCVYRDDVAVAQIIIVGDDCLKKLLVLFAPKMALTLLLQLRKLSQLVRQPNR